MNKEIDFQLFEASGRFRYPITAELRASLAPEILARVEAVEKAAKELADANALLKDAELERKQFAAIFDNAKLHLDQIRPAPTALQEQRRMMLPAAVRAELSRAPVDPAIKEAVFSAAEAEDHFEGSKVTCRNLQAVQAHAKTVVQRRVEEFQNEFQPMSPGELIRDHLKRAQQRRIDGTDKPQAPVRQILTPLDAYLAGSKGPLGVRSARQAQRHPDGPQGGQTYGPEMRGQYVKPPAQAPWAVKPRGPRS
jgi:hypothetical protein